MRYLRGHLTTVTVIVLLLTLAGVFVWQSLHKTESVVPPAMDALATEYAETGYVDFLGNRVQLADQIGSVLIVNAWASWSPESARELPLLAAIAAEYQDDNVVIVAINRAEKRPAAERFLRTIGVLERVQLVLDPDDRYYEKIGGYTMPESVFYDRDGNIVHHQRGSLTEAEVRRYLDAAIGEEGESKE